MDKSFILNLIQEILNRPSPSGYCFELMDYLEKIIIEMGFQMTRNQKGNGIVTVPGKSQEKVIGISAHLDTLGCMVRSITPGGTLKFTLVGSPIAPTLDGEYCTIKTRQGQEYTGTILSTSPSSHVYTDAGTKARTVENMEIRIDQPVTSKEQVEKLGISAGDYIFIDPKTQITSSDFIKSRFIDDKAGVVCLLGLLKMLQESKNLPEYTLKLIFSTYEEVGHGCASIPQDITELIAVDMGCIGDDLNGSEYKVSICAKDSKGPYDYHMTSEFVQLARNNNIDFALDIYPMYGSDVSAALGAGNDIKGALIGPGVHASHGMERTHYKAIQGTIDLLQAWVFKK